jgi:hypothetical protein
MLTVKQGGVRIVNPDLSLIDKDRTKYSLFGILMFECGFHASHRADVWTHTKEEQFSVRLEPEDEVFSIIFEYLYKSEKCGYPSQISNQEYIEQFLKDARKFYYSVI